MDKKSHAHFSVGWKYLLKPILQRLQLPVNQDQMNKAWCCAAIRSGRRICHHSRLAFKSTIILNNLRFEGRVQVTVRHRISCCAPSIHWKCDARMQNWQIKSPPALWKHLSFKCLGVIVALNGKSASMLLEPTKNKLNQWLVIEESVNKCNFYPRYFEIVTKRMKITDRQICEDQIVTFKQSHILLYQGLLF